MRRVGAFAAAILLHCFQNISASATPPLEAFGALPEIGDAALSPDGRRVAVLVSEGDQRHLVVHDLQAGAPLGAISFDDKARGIEWASDQYVLLRVSETQTSHWGNPLRRYEASAVFSINVETFQVQGLLTGNLGVGPHRSLSGVYASVSGENSVLMPAYNERERPTAVLWKVDLASGDGRQVAQGARRTRGFLTTPGGQALARVDYEEVSNSVRVFARDGRGWQQIHQREDELFEFGIDGADAAGTIAYFTDYGDSNTRGLYGLTLEGGEIVGPILHRADADIVDVLVGRRDHVVIGVGFASIEGTQYEFIDPTLNAAWANVVAAFPEDAVRPHSWSDDRQTWLLYVEGATAAGQFAVFEPSTADVRVVGATRPSISPQDIAPVITISYKSRDGLDISALLTIPPGADVESLPTVVLPHGGPASFDDYGWDWLAQFFANQGYAVLQPNYRGSTGFGRAFEHAGRGEWGRAVQDDVTDGVRAMITSGYTDPDRICIVGWGYGGYVALAGATFTQELYQCVAAIAPISDTQQMLSAERSRTGARSSVVSYWTDLVRGVDRTVNPNEVSPARFAQNVQAPILLVHGKDDVVNDIDQSRIMHNALQRADKTVEMVELEGADHWLSSASDRIATLTAVANFVGDHLGSTETE